MIFAWNRERLAPLRLVCTGTYGIKNKNTNGKNSKQLCGDIAGICMVVIVTVSIPISIFWFSVWNIEIVKHILLTGDWKRGAFKDLDTVL